jgi:hypothetical protein
MQLQEHRPLASGIPPPPPPHPPTPTPPPHGVCQFKSSQSSIQIPCPAPRTRAVVPGVELLRVPIHALHLRLAHAVDLIVVEANPLPSALDKRDVVTCSRLACWVAVGASAGARPREAAGALAGLGRLKVWQAGRQAGMHACTCDATRRG